MLVKNSTFRQKSKCWSKIQILVKNPNVGQNPNFPKKSKFWSKIQLFVKNQNLVKQNHTLSKAVTVATRKQAKLINFILNIFDRKIIRK